VKSSGKSSRGSQIRSPKTTLLWIATQHNTIQQAFEFEGCIKPLNLCIMLLRHWVRSFHIGLTVACILLLVENKQVVTKLSLMMLQQQKAYSDDQLSVSASNGLKTNHGQEIMTTPTIEEDSTPVQQGDGTMINSLTGDSMISSTHDGTSNSSATLPPRIDNANSLVHQTDVPSCTVQRDGNTFSLAGAWRKDAQVATALDRHNGCGKRSTIPYPFKGLHGCCSDKTAPSHVFCPDFSPGQAIVSFLNATRGRTVLLLGDSLTMQMYAAIKMELNANGIENRVKDRGSRNSIYIPGSNVKVRLLEFYRLDDVNRTGIKEEQFAPPPMMVKDSTLISAMREADIVITNVGLHYAGEPDYQYRQMLRIQDIAIREKQRRLASNPKRAELCFLWRKTFPQHFSSAAGSGIYGDHKADQVSSRILECQPLTQPWTHSSDHPMEKVRSLNNQSKVPVIDMTTILQGASMYHSTGKTSESGDCSHFCYSRLIWGPIMHLTAEAIHQAC
jgi:hypothetical protein